MLVLLLKVGFIVWLVSSVWLFTFHASPATISEEQVTSPQMFTGALRLCEVKPEIAIVVCGFGNLGEAMGLIKSLYTFNSGFILHIFVDEPIMKAMTDRLSSTLGLPYKSISLHVQLHTLEYPPGTEEWRVQRSRPCTTFRLFLPELLPDTELLMYLDADVLVLGSLRELWKEFEHFSPNQTIALAPQDMESKGGNCVGRPFNAAVLLMHLSRLRERNFTQQIDALRTDVLTRRNRTLHNFADQHLINLYFQQHPEEHRLLGCRWNYESSRCYSGQCCNLTQDRGCIIHGGGDVFLRNRTLFSQFFDVFERADRISDLTPALVKREFGKVKGHGTPQTVCVEVLTSAVLSKQDACL